MPVDHALNTLWARITPPQRAAFFSCAIAGYLTHLFAFTNLFPNSDGLSRMCDPQQMTVSGRWFLHYASALNGFTQMPALIGLLSVLFLALAAAVTVSVLRMDSRCLAGLTGIILAVFPSMGFAYLYLFTASAYALAILMAALSVWLATRRGILPFLGGVLLLAMAMGTYQAYAAFAISLAVLAVLRAILTPSISLPGAAKLSGRLVAFLALGAGAYYGILQIFLKVKHLELLDYLGMSDAGSRYPIAQLPRLVLQTYKQVLSFFVYPGSSNPFTTGLFVVLSLLCVGLAAICLLRVWTVRPSLWRTLASLVVLAILPLALGFAQIISPFSNATPLMKYAYVGAYLAVLLLADLGLPALPAPVLRTVCSTAVCLVLLAVSLYSAGINNLLYTASAQAHRSAQSYTTRLLARIEDCPGYDGTQEVVVIGTLPPELIRSSIDSYRLVDHYSVPINNLLPLNKHLYYYFNDWLNVPIAEPSEDTMKQVAQSDEFQSMPRYPAQGSVAILDGRVVVKIQDTYTPKSGYELAYENRR